MRTRLFYLFLFAIAVSCGQRTPVSDPAILAKMPKFEILINSPDAFEGYIFLRKRTGEGVQLAINSQGDIMWYQISDTTLSRVFTPYQNSYLSLFTKKEMYEITYDGDTLLKLSYGEAGYDRALHHEVIKDQDNNIIALTEEAIALDLSELGGDKIDTIKTQGIIKLSRTGEKLWSWSLGDVMDPLTYPEINKWKRDWGHANALAIDKDGNYLISWRDFEQIWKIDSNTGKVIWQYGSEAIKNLGDKFYGQHNIHVNQDGDYMILDNGSSVDRRSSRALMFNTFGDSIQNTLIIQLPDSLFTFKQGSVYQFAHDRFLFSSTMRKKLVVTNRKGEILWMAKSDDAFYRAYYIEKGQL